MTTPARRLLVAAGLLAVAIAPRPGDAHFALRTPTSWRVLDGLGNPQKTGPCGDEGTAPASGVVTTFAPGETITITLDETIFHPGHYRVALALDDRSELPAPPPVTPGTTDCGSAPIMDPVVFPVLADGMLLHADPFSGTQSFEVPLPSDVTCTRCTLQVLEFMSEHGAPCFYHHCADIAIQPPGGTCTSDLDCDDQDVCTRDVCAAGATCEHPPLALADVDATFLGALDPPACAGEDVPRGVLAQFDKAGALTLRAAETRARARRFLERAARRLERTARKVAKAENRRISVECATALTAGVTSAQRRLDCLATNE